MNFSRQVRGLVAALCILLPLAALPGGPQGALAVQDPQVEPQTGTLAIHNCNFEGNSDYGLESNTVLNAENNWWADPDGPTHPSNPSGNGDAVSDYVDFTPWLGAPVDIGIPLPPHPGPGVLTIRQNIIEGNADYGLESSIPVVAEDNWWGDASGPYHPTLNPSGLGDAVSDNVDFDPWLTSPPYTPPDFTPPAAVADLKTEPGANAAEVKLTWTAPGDDGSGGGQAERYDIRYSDQPIDASNFESLAPVPGTPPGPAVPGTKQTFEVGGMATGTRWYYALKTVDDGGNWSDLSNVPSLHDIGLRPDPDGYAFDNYGGWFPLPPASGDFTMDDMRRMFGDEEVCIIESPICIGSRVADEWRIEVSGNMNGGHCLGMSATSLRFFVGTDDHPGFSSPHDLDKGDDVVPTWDAETFTTTSRRHIAFMQAMQFPDSVKDYIADYRSTYTVTTVFDDLRQRWQGSESEWPVLGMFSSTAAHAVLPFAIEDDGADVQQMWFYENQFHDTANHLNWDAAAGIWNYEAYFFGGRHSDDLVLIPLSVFATPPGCSPWCNETGTLVEASSGQIWLSGGGHLLITDDQGRRIGYVNDSLVNEIPGASASPLMVGLNVILEPIYSVPLSQSYTMLVDGQSLTTTAKINVAQFGPDYAVKVDGVTLAPGEQDHLSISIDASALTYEAGHSKEANLILAHDGTSESYRFQIAGADLPAGNVVSLVDDAANKQVTYSHASASGGVYDLLVDRASATGEEFFRHTSIEIQATDTHHVIYGMWDGLGPITVQIDHGSDGTIDEVTVLPNQADASHIYLPLVLRGP